MRHTDVAKVLAPVASSYGAAALIGLVAAALFFVVVAFSVPDKFNNVPALLPIVVAGPVIGCLITFASRCLIDRIARRS